MPVYVVDSNFFIEAHRATYPLDVAHSFWNKVRQLADEGKIISIDKVKNEMFDNHEDALKQWCIANLPRDFFKDSVQAMAAYSQVINWANSRIEHYLPKALAEFLDADEADAFVVAFVLADAANRILVTQETSEPSRKSKIKIPEPCNALGVQYCNTIEMFRKLGQTF
jgi:hypothetical protein